MKLQLLIFNDLSLTVRMDLKFRVLEMLLQLLKFMLYGNFEMAKNIDLNIWEKNCRLNTHRQFFKLSFARECTKDKTFSITNAKNIFTCKWIFFSISAFAIIKEIASG